MSKYQGGDKVYATGDIFLTERDGTQTAILLARGGEDMVVRSESPLEVSTWTNPLFCFAVTPNQIAHREF